MHSIVIFLDFSLEQFRVPRADRTFADAMFRWPRQSSDARGPDVPGTCRGFALDHLQPRINGHPLNASATQLPRFRVLCRPVILRRNAIREIEPSVDQVRRRKHGLAFFNQLFIRGISLCHCSPVVHLDFKPLIENHKFALLLRVILPLKNAFALWSSDPA
jgi:hypothetical protein